MAVTLRFEINEKALWLYFGKMSIRTHFNDQVLPLGRPILQSKTY